MDSAHRRLRRTLRSAQLLTLVFLAAALCGQTRFTVDRTGPAWTFDAAWKDADKQARTASWSLPAKAIQKDLDEKISFPTVAANHAVAAELRAYAKTVKGAKLTVKESKQGLRLSASGRDRGRVRDVLKAAEDRQTLALDSWMGANGFIRTRKDEISFDHARLAAEYAADVAPLADALGRGKLDERAFAERALHFVQSIPYEKHLKSGGDAGYRRPLALLARNRGDCDSKAVLYLALMEAAFPDLAKVVVYIPDHAFVGLGLEKMDHESTFKRDGQEWLFAEAVGPALVGLGEAAGRSKRGVNFGGGEIHAVP